jgi:hypothetical protein
VQTELLVHFDAPAVGVGQAVHAQIIAVPA